MEDNRALVGLMFRGELAGDIRDAGREIDFLEVTAEHFLGSGAVHLPRARTLLSRWPVLVHGLDLSLGTAEEPERDATARRRDLVKTLEGGAFSEHICFTRVQGRSLGCLTPLPFSHAAIDALERRASEARERLDVPFRLENIAYYFRPPGDEMSEVGFLRRALERCDAEALLDLNNLHTNAVNHGYDPLKFLDEFPLERCSEVHIAGGEWDADTLIDSHTAEPPPEVWKYLEIVAARAPLRHVTLEWDNSFPPFEKICEVLRKARTITRDAKRPFP